MGIFFRVGVCRSFFKMVNIFIRATSQAPKRQARRGSQLVLMNLLTFLFQHLSSDLEYFYLEAAGLQRIEGGCKKLEAAGLYMIRRNWVLKGWKQQGCKRL